MVREIDFRYMNRYTESERLAMRKIMKEADFPCADCSTLNYGCGCRGWGCPSNQFMVWFMTKHLKEFQELCTSNDSKSNVSSATTRNSYVQKPASI